MTLGYRFTVAYAIIATSLLLGIGHANHRLLALDEAKPELNLKQGHRNHIGSAIALPYFGVGILVALAFIFVTRTNQNKKPNG